MGSHLNEWSGPAVGLCYSVVAAASKVDAEVNLATANFWLGSLENLKLVIVSHGAATTRRMRDVFE